MSTDFDAAARSWDTPEKVGRSRLIAGAIAAAVPLAPDMYALEYGCGTGLVTWELADRVAHVTLADTSSGMLDVVRERLAALPDDRFDVVELDLSTQPAPETFDLIYTALVLHHIADTPAVLAGFFGALRPGGYLAIADLDHDHDNRFHGHGFDGHTGFHRHILGEQIVAAGFEEPTFTTAARITKGEKGSEREFDIFLATTRRR